MLIKKVLGHQLTYHRLFSALKKASLSTIGSFFKGIKNELGILIPDDIGNELISESSKTLSLQAPAPPPANTHKDLGLPPYSPTRTLAEHHSNVMTILRLCRIKDLTSELENAISRFSKEASEASLTCLETEYISFLRRLLPKLSDPSACIYYQPLIQNILSAYVSKAVPRKPPPQRDWTRKDRGCGCQDCKSLDAFLSNPTRSSFEFRRKTEERRHLHLRVAADIREGSIQVSEVKGGTPYGLLIEKTMKIYETKLRAWEATRNAVKKVVMDLGVPQLKSLLGELFDAIIALKPIQPTPMTTPSKEDKPHSSAVQTILDKIPQSGSRHLHQKI